MADPLVAIGARCRGKVTAFAFLPIRGTLPAARRTPSYDPAESRAELAWSEVTDEAVTGLELRATAGPEYEAEDETTVATFPPEAPREWAGLFGLHQPGTAATFKLYSLTAEGRERGSNPVTVTRPL